MVRGRRPRKFSKILAKIRSFGEFDKKFGFMYVEIVFLSHKILGPQA